MKSKVSKRMKPRVASLGFTREDRESIAAEIADNLDVAEDATDEEINAAIDVAIEAAIPMLKVAQSIKNRAINESKKTTEPKQTEEGDAASAQAGLKTKLSINEHRSSCVTVIMVQVQHFKTKPLPMNKPIKHPAKHTATAHREATKEPNKSKKQEAAR